ncbi:MAG: DUF5115 domain-containing protein [Prevotella sp.]|nr:DUF5115 domain-containing protein [Prevotella sp.]
MASFVLASCNGEYDDWASPQANDPEAAAAKYGVTFSPGSEINSTMPDADGVVHLITINNSNQNISGFTVKSLTVNGEAIDAQMDGNDITVSANDLALLIEKQHNSRASVAREVKIVTTASANLSNGEAVTIDLTGEATGSLTPKATPTIDSKGYFMLGDFANVGWNLGTPLWMTDNGDGTYTATVNTNSTGSNWFKFYGGSFYSNSDWDTVNKGVMGCKENGDDALSGFVVYTGDDAAHAPNGVQTLVISGQGTFEVTLDMKNLVYTVKRAEAKYYLIGNMQTKNWTITDIDCMFYAQGGNKYSYTTKFNGAWDLKFVDSKGLGNWDVAWGTSVDGDNSPSGSLINSKSQSFAAPTKGEYYTLTIDMNTQTYSWIKLTDQAPTAYNSVSLIGDFNNWKGDVDLKQEVNAPHNWYGRVTIPSNGALKFRANHGWDASWGTSAADKSKAIGDLYYLSLGGENITVPAGTYDFYLNDITGNWSIVAIK